MLWCAYWWSLEMTTDERKKALHARAQASLHEAVRIALLERIEPVPRGDRKAAAAFGAYGTPVAVGAASAVARSLVGVVDLSKRRQEDISQGGGKLAAGVYIAVR